MLSNTKDIGENEMDNLSRALELITLAQSSYLKVMCSSSEFEALKTGIENYPPGVQPFYINAIAPASGSVILVIPLLSVVVTDAVVSIRLNIIPPTTMKIWEMDLRTAVNGCISVKSAGPIVVSPQSPMVMEWFFIRNNDLTSTRPDILQYTDESVAWDKLS
jgi:hypothetical protein